MRFLSVFIAGFLMFGPFQVFARKQDMEIVATYGPPPGMSAPPDSFAGLEIREISKLAFSTVGDRSLSSDNLSFYDFNALAGGEKVKYGVSSITPFSFPLALGRLRWVRRPGGGGYYVQISSGGGLITLFESIVHNTEGNSSPDVNNYHATSEYVINGYRMTSRLNVTPGILFLKFPDYFSPGRELKLNADIFTNGNLDLFLRGGPLRGNIKIGLSYSCYASAPPRGQSTDCKSGSDGYVVPGPFVGPGVADAVNRSILLLFYPNTDPVYCYTDLGTTPCNRVMMSGDYSGSFPLTLRMS